jgi:hypothetical protein
MGKISAKNTEANSMLALAKTEAQEVGTQLEAYKLQLEEMQEANSMVIERLKLANEDKEAMSNENLNQISQSLQTLFDEQAQMKAEQQEQMKRIQNAINNPKVVEKVIKEQSGMMNTIDLSGIEKSIKALEGKITSPKKTKKKIERDENGMVVSVGGKKVKRDQDGLIIELGE